MPRFSGEADREAAIGVNPAGVPMVDVPRYMVEVLVVVTDLIGVVEKFETMYRVE